MYLLAAYLQQCQISLCLQRTFTFVFLYSIIMAETVSLGSLLVRSICSIFPLFMELNALENLTNSVALRFLHEHLLEFDR